MSTSQGSERYSPAQVREACQQLRKWLDDVLALQAPVSIAEAMDDAPRRPEPALTADEQRKLKERFIDQATNMTEIGVAAERLDLDSSVAQRMRRTWFDLLEDNDDPKIALRLFAMIVPPTDVMALKDWIDRVATRSYVKKGPGQRASDDFKPADWFTRKTNVKAPRLRQAARSKEKRKTRRVRTKMIDGVKHYSVADAHRHWPDDMESKA